MEGMSSASVRLTMSGTHGSIALGTFGKVLDQFQALTTAIARDQAIEGATWKLSNLEIGSAMAEAAIDILDDGPALARDLVHGVAAIREEPAIPAAFPLSAMGKVISMGRAARDNPVKLELLQGGLSATIDRVVALNGARAQRQTTRSLGGFYGTVELFDMRRNRKFGIRDEFTRRWIPCIAETDQILGDAKELIGSRVYVSGEIVENAARQPLRIDVQAIDPQPWSGTVPVLGDQADLGEGTTAARLIRESRDW